MFHSLQYTMHRLLHKIKRKQSITVQTFQIRGAVVIFLGAVPKYGEEKNNNGNEVVGESG